MRINHRPTAQIPPRIRRRGSAPSFLCPSRTISRASTTASEPKSKPFSRFFKGLSDAWFSYRYAADLKGKRDWVNVALAMTGGFVSLGFVNGLFIPGIFSLTAGLLGVGAFAFWILVFTPAANRLIRR